MEIPSKGNTMYSYGALIVDKEDILDVEELEYAEEQLPSIPISAILREGLIAHGLASLVC